MISNILKDKSGSGYIDSVIVILVSVLMIAFTINVYPVFVAKADLNYFASEVIREAEITGAIGDNVNNKIDKLKKELINVDLIDFKTNYIDNTKKVQLDSKIEVTVEKTIDIGFFEFGSFPIKLRATDHGYSEVYWK